MQQDRLKHLETIISNNQYRFYEIGQALKEIRDSRLYKLILFNTFEAYARDRWDIGRSQAYRLIDAYSVINNLSPIGDRLPGNETQTRPLVQLDPVEQRKLWKEFLRTGMELNARNIKNFIDKRKAKENFKPTDRTGQISEEYMQTVQEMLNQVQIAQNDHWQKTSRQAALLWHRVIREKILSKEPDNGSDI
jgi:hypothetical protein